MAMAKDLDLFKSTMAGVTPLRGRKSRQAVRAPASAERSASPAELSPSSLGMKQVAASRIEAFDRSVDRALARGLRAPEATLDLHGLTLAAAERAVARFLVESVEQGRRVVLIVTGKGMRLEGGRVFGGRIRAEFPGWLDRPDNRALIAGFRTAHPRHGGSGASYVLLRRRRSLHA
jgi:DNA-nicking Smr family endonuclease